MSATRICPIHVISLVLMGALIGILFLYVSGQVPPTYARNTSEVLLLGLALSGCQLFLYGNRGR